MVYGILREMVPVCFCCRADGNQNPFPRLEEFSVRNEATMIDQIVTFVDRAMLRFSDCGVLAFFRS